MSKLLVATLVGRAVHRGELSLDDPVSRWVREWRADDRAWISVRHVLGHASGLDSTTWAEVSAKGPTDLRRYVVDELALTHAPGTHVAYNNLATMVLPLVLEAATERPFDRIVEADLLEPLGIRHWAWLRDGAGHALSMSGAQLSARDLARVGRLLAEDGVCDGRTLLEPGWTARCAQPVAGNGRLGLGLMRYVDDGRVVALGHDGSGGQHLWVYPRSGLVVARLRDLPWDAEPAAALAGLPALGAALDAEIVAG